MNEAISVALVALNCSCIAFMAGGEYIKHLWRHTMTKQAAIDRVVGEFVRKKMDDAKLHTIVAPDFQSRGWFAVPHEGRVYIVTVESTRATVDA